MFEGNNEDRRHEESMGILERQTDILQTQNYLNLVIAWVGAVVAIVEILRFLAEQGLINLKDPNFATLISILAGTAIGILAVFIYRHFKKINPPK